MRRSAAIAALLFLVLTVPAWAVIQVLYPLQKLMDDSDYIFQAEIDKIDPERPSLVMIQKDVWKGKPAFDRIPVNLSGDKEKHTPKFLKRVAPKLPVICFVKKQSDKSYMMLGYTNGTWFQALGTTDAGTTRWAFTHVEIYMRRTYRGTTAEMETTVKDALSGKAKAPAPDARIPAGFGPEVEAPKEK